jgi:hypothetical protein
VSPEAIYIAGNDNRGLSGRQRAEDGESSRVHPQGTPVARVHRQHFDGKAALTKIRTHRIAPDPDIQVGNRL